MSITALYRGRVAVAGYLLGMGAGWLGRSLPLGATISLTVLIVHFIAYRVSAHRNIQGQMESLHELRSTASLSTQHFYLRSKESVPMANPPPQEGLEWGPRKINDIEPSHFLRKLTLRAALQRKPVRGKLLDIGCLAGQISIEFSHAGSSVILMDLDRASLVHAMDRTNRPGIVAAAEQLPFKDGVFDGVGCLEVVEHLDSPEPALAEIHRVMKRGAKLYLTTDNRNCVLAIHLLNPLIVLERILGLFFDSLLPPRNLVWQGASREVTYPHTEFSGRELSSYLKRSGFELRTAATYYFEPGGHRLLCRLNPELTEKQYAEKVLKVESVLRHIPIIRKLGTHWWVEARR